MKINNTTERPWGTYEVLYDGPKCKVKKIVVKPGQKPSYQYHHQRNEVWTVIEGTGVLTLNDIKFAMNVGDTFEIPVGAKHRPHNNGVEDLVFIETQWGEYFGEDDIVRIEDEYNRV